MVVGVGVLDKECAHGFAECSWVFPGEEVPSISIVDQAGMGEFGGDLPPLVFWAEVVIAALEDECRVMNVFEVGYEIGVVGGELFDGGDDSSAKVRPPVGAVLRFHVFDPFG